MCITILGITFCIHRAPVPAVTLHDLPGHRPGDFLQEAHDRARMLQAMNHLYRL